MSKSSNKRHRPPLGAEFYPRPVREPFKRGTLAESPRECHGERSILHCMRFATPSDFAAIMRGLSQGENYVFSSPRSNPTVPMCQMLNA